MNKLNVELRKAKKQIEKVVRKKHPKTDNLSVTFNLHRGEDLKVKVHTWEGEELPNSYYPPRGLTVNQIKNYIRFNKPFEF